METLAKKWRDNKAVVTHELRTQAAKHASKPGSRLGMLPNNHKRHSGRGVERRLHAYPNVNADSVRFLANSAEPNFDKMIGIILDDQLARERFRTLGEVASMGARAGIATLHDEDPVDIAFGEGLAICVLKELGYEPKFGLVLSKIMSHLGFQLRPGGEPVPTVDLLRRLGNVYLSFPRTESIKNSDIADDVISVYNANLKYLFKKDQSKGNFIGCVAPTGTMGKPREDDPTIWDIAPVIQPTVDMFGGFILPIAMRMFTEDPLVAVLRPRAVTTLPAMDNMLQELCRENEELLGNTRQLVYPQRLLEA